MEKNCEFFSVDPSQELSRLLVHGVLHLVGWDHATNEMDEPMLIKQEELLKIVEKESIS
jgi:probable rRNA maturation factor